jgi:leucyl aminopeptidase (aminopeptidase T)
VLNLDYAALKRTMTTLAARMANRTLRVTDPQGTDIRFQIGARFHQNYGDASRGRISGMTNARDKEEEIPCGCLRTIPFRDSVEGIIAFQHGFGFPAAGYGLDVNRFVDHGLRFRFKDGRVVRIETGGDQAELDRLWVAETGDKDRLGEFVLGCNPNLKPVPGCGFQPYYGFGDAILRLTLGENIESGGQNVSSTHRWLMLLNSTIVVDGIALVENGKLTAAGRGD